MSKKQVNIATTKKSSRKFIIFYNDTSRLECLDYDIIDFVHLDETEFSLIIPENTCAQGHLLTFLIFDNLKEVKKHKKFPSKIDPTICIELKGKVNSLERISRGFAEIQVGLINKYSEQWQTIIGEFDKKQEKALELFKKYKK